MSEPLTPAQILDGALKFGYLQYGEMTYATADYDQALDRVLVSIGNNTWETNIDNSSQAASQTPISQFTMTMGAKNTDTALEEIMYN